MFSTRLKQLREEKNILQKTIADTIGVSQPTYTLYENGKREPNFETLLKIAKYFNVTTDYLLGASECKSAENDDINKRLGLSDEAIKVLQELNAANLLFKDNTIKAINLLLENESYWERNNNDIDVKGKKISNNILLDGIMCKDTNLKISIFESIKKYFNAKLTAKGNYAITTQGYLQYSYNENDEEIYFSGNDVDIKNEDIENALLFEIQRKLITLKETANKVKY